MCYGCFYHFKNYVFWLCSWARVCLFVSFSLSFSVLVSECMLVFPSNSLFICDILRKIICLFIRFCLSSSVWFLFSLFHAIIVCFCRWIYPWSSMYIRHCRFFSCNSFVQFFSRCFLWQVLFFSCTFIRVQLLVHSLSKWFDAFEFYSFSRWQIISLSNVFDSIHKRLKQNAGHT